MLVLEIEYWRRFKVESEATLKQVMPADEYRIRAQRYMEIIQHLANLDRKRRKLPARAAEEKP
jgi:hypothetical protein